MPASCWIVVEKGLTGTENQCRAVASALGVTPAFRHVGLREPWRSLSPYLALEQGWSFSGDPLTPPWPDLVIAAGRKGAAAARYIKRQAGDSTFVAVLQDPHMPAGTFDLLAVPAHDTLRGPNVVVTAATPNRVTPELLATEQAQFASVFSSLPRPRVAVLIGGSSNSYFLTPEIARATAAELRKLAVYGAGLMVTASRRTPPECRAIIEEALAGTGAYIWDGSGANPYYGMLAIADYILVTADSASMISEAATSGKPVYLISLAGGSAKFDRLHANLMNAGIVRSFQGNLEPYGYTPLDDAAMVAGEIRKRMKRE